MRPCDASPIKVHEPHTPLLAFLLYTHIGQPSISMCKALAVHKNAMCRVQSLLYGWGYRLQLIKR